VGASIAVGWAWILRGPGGDPTSIAAGSGALAAAHKIEEEVDARRRGSRHLGEDPHAGEGADTAPDTS
jgi:hypothetical protein